MTTLDPRSIPLIDSSLKPSFRVQRFVAVVTIVSLAAIARFGLIAWPFWNDSGLYIALGRSIAHGDVMYRDFYETKLPGVGMLMSAAWRAFGSCWPAYVIAQFAMTLAAAGAIARAVGRHVHPAAAIPCFLYAVAYLNFDFAVFTGFQLETIEALFECLAAASAIEVIAATDSRSAFTSGLAAGVAAMAKPGGAGVAVALVVIFLVTRRWRPVVAVAGGFAIPTTATVVFTLGTGAGPYLMDAVHDIQRYSSATPMQWGDAIKVLVLLIGLAIPFALARPDPRMYMRGLFPFVAIWFALDLSAAIAQRRMYLYYFLPLAGPAAVLFGVAARKLNPLLITIGLLPVGLLSLTWEACSPAQWVRGTQTTPLAAYIVKHTNCRDAIYIDPPGRLTIETDRDPGVSAGLLFYWVNDDAAPARCCERMIADFESRRTKYVVLADSWDVPIPQMADGDILSRCPGRRAAFIQNWARFRTYLHSHYELETAIDRDLIFRRRK